MKHNPQASSQLDEKNYDNASSQNEVIAKNISVFRKSREKNSESKMASVRRSLCLMLTIFTKKQPFFDTTDSVKSSKHSSPRRWVGRQTLCWPRLKAIHFSWLGPELLVCCLAHRGPTNVFLLLRS